MMLMEKVLLTHDADGGGSYNLQLMLMEKV
jgi:hypothetical protein